MDESRVLAFVWTKGGKQVPGAVDIQVNIE